MEVLVLVCPVPSRMGWLAWDSGTAPGGQQDGHEGFEGQHSAQQGGILA